MIEDKLTHDERLRLECLAQTVALHTMKPTPSAEGIISTAQKFESFVKGQS